MKIIFVISFYNILLIHFHDGFNTRFFGRKENKRREQQKQRTALGVYREKKKKLENEYGKTRLQLGK